MIDRNKFARGIELFNAADFYAAHEELEDVWREMQGEERRVMQGVVQVAVALHHHATGNLHGARSVLARALRNLENAGEELYGLELAPLRASLCEWLDALQSGAAPPRYPRLVRNRVVDF